MQNLKPNLVQRIINKSNSKIDFTIDLKPLTARYIVSIKNIYYGKNPSLKYDLNKDINEAINRTHTISKYYDSIGGWKDENQNYCLDANIHFHNIHLALETAKIFKQKAIFDKVNNEVILVDNNNLIQL